MVGNNKQGYIVVCSLSTKMFDCILNGNKINFENGRFDYCICDLMNPLKCFWCFFFFSFYNNFYILVFLKQLHSVL